MSEIQRDIREIKLKLADMATAAQLSTLTGRVTTLETAIEKTNGEFKVIHSTLNWHRIIGAAVILAAIGFVKGWIPSHADLGRVQNEVQTNISKLENSIGKLESNVGVLLKANGLAVLAVSDQQEFAKLLSTLNEIMSKPVAEVKPTAATLQLISTQLRAMPTDLPNYWPTVLRFIQFASSVGSSQAPPPGPAVLFTDNQIMGRAEGTPFEEMINLGKRIQLEGGGLTNVIFRNYRIIFTENPVKMQNVTFINCVFEMPQVKTPNPYLRNAASQLLASQFGRIKEAG